MTGEAVALDGEDLGNLQNKYIEFWNHLVNQAGGDAEKVDNNAVTWRMSEDDRISVSMSDSEGFWFKGIRDLSGGAVLDICVQFQAVIRGAEVDGTKYYEIVDSKTNVLYINKGQQSQEPEIEFGVRFEYGLSPQDNHPVFHAHYDPTCVSSNALRRRYDGLMIESRTSPEYPRIPTAPMDVLSVTQHILHDHKPDVVVDETGWPPGTERVLSQLPVFPTECFEHSPQSGRCMVSDWWYLRSKMDPEDGLRRQVPEYRYQ